MKQLLEPQCRKAFYCMKENKKDAVIADKILRYCEEIAKTHEVFNNDKDLFFNKKNGFIYRNAITMPILQIGELVKNFSEEFTAKYNSMTWNTSVEDIVMLKEYLMAINFMT